MNHILALNTYFCQYLLKIHKPISSVWQQISVSAGTQQLGLDSVTSYMLSVFIGFRSHSINFIMCLLSK